LFSCFCRQSELKHSLPGGFHAKHDKFLDHDFVATCINPATPHPRCPPIHSPQARRLDELPDKHFFIQTLSARINHAGRERLALQVVECPEHPAGRPGELEDGLAKRIYANIRSGDLVARIDTNTIAILFNEVESTAEAISIAQRILSLTCPPTQPPPTKPLSAS
jgi:hypothetical protein